MIANRRDLIKRFLLGTAGVLALRDLEGAAAVAAVTASELAADPRRPQYHLLPPANWMNDPNGPIYWRGQYHMFYQYNPDASVWGDMHWGHAVSPDMVRWKHLPVALSPTPGGPDADGCFSGTAVVQGDRVAVLYTGVRSVPESEATLSDGVHSLRETQCLAYSHDSDLKSWIKLPRPVIAAPPQGLSVTGFRDPTPWREGDDWLLAIGSGFPNRGGAVLLYRSKDLRYWEYLHPLVSSETPGGGAANPVDSGDMWECPDFFPLGNRHVLIYSTKGKSRWMTGAFDRQALKFNPEQAGTLDTGAYYAAKTQTDKAGNRVLWGWIPETRPVEAYRAAGWACLMSLPRILTLGSDGRLRMNIAPEVHQLRRSEQRFIHERTEEQRLQQIAQMKIDAACGEIAFVVQAGSQAFNLSIYPDDREPANQSTCLSLSFDPGHPGQITIDDKSLALESGRTQAELSLYIDSSVIELILNGRVAHTKRFYLPGARPRNLRFKWAGTTGAIERLSVWQLTPISRNRLTT
ncbi:MAG TPA: glycoside hydrolase family 32 protein [Terracidiphilus sp.]|nr:glycoside hydrolase family 32 protein [Terracidiphilus sp.]